MALTSHRNPLPGSVASLAEMISATILSRASPAAAGTTLSLTSTQVRVIHT